MNPTTLTRPCCDVESTSLTLIQRRNNVMYWTHGGTGMISSSSAFRLHPKKGHWDLFRLLHAVMHRTKTLVYSFHPRETVAIIFGRIVSVIRWLLRSTVVPMQLPYQCRHCQCSVTTLQGLMLAVVALKQSVLFGRVKGNTLKNPPCLITPPSRHHLYSIGLINGLHCFYRITMSTTEKWRKSNNLLLQYPHA